MRHPLSLSLLGVLLLVNCGSDPGGGTGGSPGAELLAPPPAGAGVQYRMVSTIEPGQEIERCQLFVAPKEGMFVRKDEVRFSAGSHHVLLYSTPYTELPTKNLKGQTVDATKIHDCADGATAEWSVNGVLAGSQSGDGDSIVGDLPAGVAVKVEPGTVLVMNTHYLNASSDARNADARINLYTLPADQVKTEAGILFYYNPFIRVPANGTATARMRCPVQEDITLVRVQSHMHRRGVGFSALLGDSAGGNQKEIYSTTEWERVPAKEFDPMLQIKAGQTLDYRCDYKNLEARTVTQGQSTKDEMCMLIGPYFPRNANLENCAGDDQEFAATWVGSGTTTCGDAMSCIGGAQTTDELYGCVVNSCPAASAALSDFLRCELSIGHGACTTECSGAGADCLTCLQQACGAQSSACQATACN